MTGGRRWARARMWIRPTGGHVLQGLLTVWVASVVAFLLVPLAPGSPAVSLLRATLNRMPTPAEIAAKEAALGLDRPLVVRYLEWLGRVVQGDLGRTWSTGYSVNTLMGQRIGPTLMLAGIALLLSTVATLLLGLIAARYRNRFPDHAIRVSTLLIGSIPAFVIGLLILQYVVIGLGVGRVITDGTLQTVWLPAIVLGLVGVSGRGFRALLLEQTSAPYMKAMTARGASRDRLMYVHAFSNAMVPYMGFLGLSIGGLIAGTMFAETIFSWPGLGALAVNSVLARDVPVIQAFVLITTVLYVVGSVLSDIVADVIDPRRRLDAGVVA